MEETHIDFGGADSSVCCQFYSDEPNIFQKKGCQTAVPQMTIVSVLAKIGDPVSEYHKQDQ